MQELTSDIIRKWLRPRSSEGNKGSFGHLLFVSGQKGMAGASILSARAAFRSGVGKVSIHIPRQLCDILQIAVPEALVILDKVSDVHWGDLVDLKPYQACVIGPGIGIHEETHFALGSCLQIMQQSGSLDRGCTLLLDADALNIFALDFHLLSLLPKGSILTPHLGEMRRLCTSLGLPGESWNDMRSSARVLAKELEIHIVLKNFQTDIYTASGKCYIYSGYGDSALATAGSGDVLSGIIGALLAQGYDAVSAAGIGVFIHQEAGRKVAKLKTAFSTIASDIIEAIPDVFTSLLQ